MAVDGKRALICFVHIERAGGTTLHTIFRNNHPFGYLPLTPRSIWSNEPGHVFTPDEARYLLKFVPSAKGFGGHTVRSYVDYERVLHRPVRYITFLRDPVGRYISHCNYHRKVMGIDWSLDAFLRERRLHNFMTRRLAGSFDLEAAKEQLATRVSFVGLTERFDESLILMRAELGMSGLDVRYETQNKSRDPQYRKDPELGDEATLERIREVNALDQELYEFAVGQIYPARVARFGPGLEQAVAQLREANSGFRFSKLRRACWTAYRYLGYRNLEWVLERTFRGQANTYEGATDEAGAASP